MLDRIWLGACVIAGLLVALAAPAASSSSVSAAVPDGATVAEAGAVTQTAMVDAYLQGIQHYNDALVQYQADLDREAAAAAQAAQAAAQAAAARDVARPAAPAPVSSGTGACSSGGGCACSVPEAIVSRESGGNYCAANASGACGAYQIMPGTWAGFGGYASACDAPPAVQDAKAASMAPCNWNPPRYCAG